MHGLNHLNSFQSFDVSCPKMVRHTLKILQQTLMLNQTNSWLIEEENFTINLCKIKNNNILMYSTHNEGRSVITEWLIKTLKRKNL